ncbi:MAG: rubredoxin [Halioglobus sp.]
MSESDFKKYECVICGFIYDEAEGLPDDGFPAGTLWADIPDDWECPDCGISKTDFDLLEE